MQEPEVIHPNSQSDEQAVLDKIFGPAEAGEEGGTLRYKVMVFQVGGVASAVHVIFSRPVQLVGLTINQARDLATSLRRAANAIERGSAKVGDEY